MSVDESHLVAVALGDARDEVLHVADGSANGCHGLSRSEPGIDLELLPSLDQLKIEVQMLEIPCELAARAFHFDHLRSDLHFHSFWDVHRLRCQDRLHLDQHFVPSISAEQRDMYETLILVLYVLLGRREKGLVRV